MKKLKPIISILLSILILATAFPAIPAKADGFNGFSSGLQPSGTNINPTKGGKKKVTTKKRTKPVPPEATPSKYCGWRMYLITADDENGNVNPRLMVGTDVIDIQYSSDFLDEIDAHALFNRITDDEVSRYEVPIRIDGSTMPSPKNNNSNQWFRTKTKSGKVRAYIVIQEYWGEDIAKKFATTDDGYNFLVMEPINWGKILSTLSCDKKYKAIFGNEDHLFYGTNNQWLAYMALLGIDVNDWGYKTFLGRKMPLAAMFEYNWLTLQNTKSVYQIIARDRALNYPEIGDYAFAIQAFRGSDFAAQSTCDETPNPPKIPGDPSKPHKSPDESDGKWKIHKTYRTKLIKEGGKVEYQNDGQFLDDSTTNTIQVEDEEEYNGYKLVDWSTQKQIYTPNVPTWESDVMPKSVQKGTSEATVTMPTENYAKEEIIYLLLERSDIETKPIIDDYAIPESMVTREISLRYTDSDWYKGYFTANKNTNSMATTGTNRVSGTKQNILLGKEFKWSREGWSCGGHDYVSDIEKNYHEDGSYDEEEVHSTAYCTWEWLDKDLKLSIENRAFTKYPESIITNLSQFMAGAKSLESTKSANPGKEYKWLKPEDSAYKSTSSETTDDMSENATGANKNTDKNEWTYKMVIHRGEEKLVIPEWKGGDYTLTQNPSYTKGNKPNSVSAKNSADYDKTASVDFEDSSVKNSTHMEGSHDTKDYYGNSVDTCGTVSKTAELKSPFKKNIKIGVMVYHGMQGVSDEFQYADTSGSATNTASKIHTLKTADDKASHVAGSDMSRWASGYEVDTGNQSEGLDITFYPYVQMWYEKLLKQNYESDPFHVDYKQTNLAQSLPYQSQTAAGKTYVMGLYERGVEAYNFAEVLWEKPADEDHPNLKLNSDQWSTHATVTQDVNTLGWNYGGTVKTPITVLPGGAIIRVGVDPDVKEQRVKLVSFQVMPSNEEQNKAAGANTVYGAGGKGTGGLEQVKATGGGTYVDSSEKIPQAFQQKHEAYVNSFIELFEQKNLEQWENRDADESPFDGVKVYNDPSPSSLGDLETATDNKASSEDKYYFKMDASEENQGKHYDRSKESSQESDLDVKVVGSGEDDEHDVLPYTKTGIYVAYADVKGNVHQVYNNHVLNGATAGSAQAINERTMAYTNLCRAVERKTGYDTTKWGKMNNGTANWYSEAFDGITVIVQETDLVVSLKYPAERSQVYDPKLTAPNTGGQATLFNGGKDLSPQQKLDHYRSAAFRTNPYDDPDPDSDTGKNRVGTMDCDVYSDKLDQFFVSRRFYIPSATTQDLR